MTINIILKNHLNRIHSKVFLIRSICRLRKQVVENGYLCVNVSLHRSVIRN